MASLMSREGSSSPQLMFITFAPLSAAYTIAAAASSSWRYVPPVKTLNPALTGIILHLQATPAIPTELSGWAPAIPAT